MNHVSMYKHLLFVLGLSVLADAVILDDFESGTNKNLLGGRWTAYADRSDSGNSTIVNGVPEERTDNSFIVMPTADEGYTGAGLMMNYEYGTVSPHYGNFSWGSLAGIGTTLSNETNGHRDLSDIAHISFRIKSNTSGLIVRFKVPTSDIADKGYYGISLFVKTIWTEYAIKFDTLSQPSWAISHPFNPANATGLEWEVSSEDGNPKNAKLYLDDMEIEGYDSIKTYIVNNDPASSTNRRPSFYWHPVDRASSYSLQVYCSPDAHDPVWDSAAIKISSADTVYTPPVDLNIGYVYWRVKSDISGWSFFERRHISDGSRPIPITVESPTVERRPIVRWHPSKTPPSSYSITFSTKSDGSGAIDFGSTADTFFQPAVYLPIGAIYWGVSGSETSSFTIIDGRIPRMEEFPGNASCNRRPSFRWKKTSPAVSGYTLQICSRGDFKTGAPLFGGWLADTFYTCAQDLPIGTLYWRINGGESDFSYPRSFVILDSRVPEPIPFTPKITDNHLPILRWHAVSGATSYTMEMDTVSAFADPVMSVPVLDTFFNPTTALPGGHYYWRVKSGLVSTWSNIDDFTIQADSVSVVQRFAGADPKKRINVSRRFAGVMLSSSYSLSSDAIKVYDVLGHCVAAPAIATASGRSGALWKFTDRLGRVVPAGTYLIRIAGMDGAIIYRVTKY